MNPYLPEKNILPLLPYATTIQLEVVLRRYSVKKVFLEISQNSQENTCARVSFLIKLQALKKGLWHRCFTVNFAKFLRTPFLHNTYGRLLLRSQWRLETMTCIYQKCLPYQERCSTCHHKTS